MKQELERLLDGGFIYPPLLGEDDKMWTNYDSREYKDLVIVVSELEKLIGKETLENQLQKIRQNNEML